MTKPVGKFALVLHSHLPWLAHHGSWPVGEEWLYQSWADSYLRVFDVLHRLAQRGRTNLVTLGMTPVLANQLDDPYCLRQFETWLGFWEQRAHELAIADRSLKDVAAHEIAMHHQAAQLFGRDWRSGASPILRSLIDANAIELLSGPATHPFQPLLDDVVADYCLQVGRDDSHIRLGQMPTGIWAPECGYRPGLEGVYHRNGITHFMVDGPALLHVGASTSSGWRVHDSEVVVFGRDLDVTYRVWSPRRGYPGGQWYRDFHTFHETGFHHKRVTSPRVDGPAKAIYDPTAAHAAVAADATDFVAVVRTKLESITAQTGQTEPLVVAGYDTELFGHWWHEGPLWLEQILELLPQAGVEVTTLDQARKNGQITGSAALENSSWGSGKDFTVWNGEPVTDMVRDNDELTRRWRKIANANSLVTCDPALDQLARNALLALSSDWAFMVTKDSAANYARERHRGHHEDFRRLAGAIESVQESNANAAEIVAELLESQHRNNNPFPRIDGRLLADV